MTTSNKLTKKELNQVFWRSFGLEWSWNYERQMNMSYCYSMLPVIKKLYPNKEDQVAAMKRHLEFFNTTPQLATLILGISAAMEESNANDPEFDTESINSVKVSLMGPLAGMGDTIWQGVVIPILLAVCIDLTRSGSGNVWGAVIYAVVIVVAAYALSYWNFMFGYKAGSEAIMDFLEKGILNKLIKGASIMGCMVMGGLIVNYVKAACGLKIVSSTTTYSIQTNFLDQVCPSILPLAVTLLVYYLMNKKRWSSLKIIGLIVVIGIVGGVTGILAY